MVMPCLYEDGTRIETKISHRVGDLNLEGDLNLQENLQRWCAGNAERKGTSEGSVNLKLLIKERDLMMLLLQTRKTTSDEGGDVCLSSSSTHVDHEAWLIDSGASFHFTPHREWFCEYEKYDGGDVFLGDDRKARIIGRGKVKLKLQGGRVRTLPGVLHIPALARNLISVSKLDDEGVKTAFEKDTCKMVRGALVLMQGVRIGTLYKLQGSIVVDGCNSSMVPENGAENLVVSREKTMLWHQRLGHIGEKGLRILHGKGMVEGMSNSSLDFDFCENCVYGKQNRVSFPSGGKRTKQILELVQSDVFGPVKVLSLGKFV